MDFFKTRFLLQDWLQEFFSDLWRRFNDAVVSGQFNALLWFIYYSKSLKFRKTK